MKLVTIVILFVVIISCSGKGEPVEIEPPHTPVLTSESLWGMANKPYLRVMKEPQMDTVIVGILRRGDKVEILSKVGNEREGTFWTEIRLPDNSATGWVESHDINVYASKTQAETARILLYGKRG